MFVLAAAKNRLTVEQTKLLTSGASEVNYCQINFDAIWDGMTREVVFRAGDHCIDAEERDGLYVIPEENALSSAKTAGQILTEARETADGVRRTASEVETARMGAEAAKNGAVDERKAAEQARIAVENLTVSTRTLENGVPAHADKSIDPVTGIVNLEFCIPEGDTGAVGPQGPQGPRGYPAVVNGVSPDESGSITVTTSQIYRPSDGGSVEVWMQAYEALMQTQQELSKWPHRNLLDNWYFADPINQRGQTEYTSSGRTMDRWIKIGGTILMTDEGLSFSGSHETNDYIFDIRQVLDSGLIKAVIGRQARTRHRPDPGPPGRERRLGPQRPAAGSGAGSHSFGGDGMKPEMRDKILAYNREKKADKEKADDLLILLDALPPGQVKQLLKDKTCAAILKKHGVEGAQ